MKRFFNLLKVFVQFLADLYRSRALLWALSKQDLKKGFAGSFLGVIWAFVQPIVTIMILWVLFEKGFRVKPSQGYPFILYLMAGIIPFFFFQNSMATGSSAVLEYKYMLKKVNFRVAILPLVKIISSMIIHAFFLLVLFAFFMAYRFYPSLYALQIIFYLFGLIVFLVGFTWLSSALVVFFRDLGEFINVALQMWFWWTPIFYSLDMIPKKLQFIWKINPMFYIGQGYRDALIQEQWFWEHASLSAYYWSISVGVFLIGAIVFKKLRPHFADVV